MIPVGDEARRDGAPLRIEVRGWRRDADGYASSVATVAEGFGVYLHNPLAFHLRDFEPGVGTRDQALAAALEWADALGEHLVCDVHTWGFYRDTLEPLAGATDAGELAEVAATLWEAALHLKARYIVGPDRWPGSQAFADRLALAWDRHGTAAMRMQIVGYAADCDRAWRALTPDEQEAESPFDWEFAPRWLRDKLESVL